MKEIFTAALSGLRQGNALMLATLTAHAGSTPRGMGSQMLLDETGRIAGTIGGGVAEKEMTALGVRLLHEKQSGTRTYALHGKAGERIGSVCGGDITVYFQYIAAGDPAWIELAQKLLEQYDRGCGGWLVLRLDGGAPALLGEDGTCLAGIRDFAGPDAKDAERFFMPVTVAERAVIFGAGHCAQALAPLLASVGFRVVVYDDRAQYADAALFPQAERVICGSFEEIEKHLTLAREDYVIAMASRHSDDLNVMRQVLAEDRAYTGMIGSKPKRAFIFGKLLEEGIPQERIGRVHTPIGLDIKAVTPAEIAVSIAAELVLERAKNRESMG